MKTKFWNFRNKIPYLFLILFSCAFSSIQAQNQKSIPLLLVGGFSVESQSFSMEKVKEMYQNQEIWVLPEVQTIADKVLGKGGKILTRLDDFRKLAKTDVLITDLKNISPHFQAFPINNIQFFENPEKYPLCFKEELSPLRTNFADFFRDGSNFFLVKNPIAKTWGLYNPKQEIYIPLDYLKQKNEFEKEDLTHLIITGVTAITRRTGANADEKGIDYLTESVRSYFQNADFVHLSNEVSFLPNCEFVAGVKFCSKIEHFQALLDLNVNIVELTGNHNSDFGREAFKETFEWYQEQNIQTFGGGLNANQANAPLIIETKTGEKIAFIGFNELCPLGECATENQAGANPYKAEKARKNIEVLKKQGFFVIASVQFGERNTYNPRTEQEEICKDLIDFGADLVYGSQAHQVQQVEFYKGKTILYGLGNFLFDQQYNVGIRQGYFLNCYFYKGKLVQMIPIYTMISGARPIIATPSEANAIRNSILIDSKIYQ